MKNNSVYVPKIVSFLRKQTRPLYPMRGKIKDYLSQYLALKELDLLNNNHFIWEEINNYHPGLMGKGTSIIQGLPRKEINLQAMVAYEHGFSSWEEIRESLVFNPLFEEAIEAIIKGDILLLKKLLNKDESLIHASSSFGHHASLLHYTANNGVELYRQIVPANLFDTVLLLISRGADRTATMKVYGGDFTTFELMTSTGHLSSAGWSDLEIQEICALVKP